MQNIAAQFKAGFISPPVHALFNKEVAEIGDALKKIFAASFQVLPFLYTHMVSLSCTIYLMGSAFLRGAAFTPEADLPGGLIIPLIYVVLTNLTIYGLLCVGDTVFDPFGDDYEDFAVLRFIEHTATASYEATSPVPLPSMPALHRTVTTPGLPRLLSAHTDARRATPRMVPPRRVHARRSTVRLTSPTRLTSESGTQTRRSARCRRLPLHLREPPQPLPLLPSTSPSPHPAPHYNHYPGSEVESKGTAQPPLTSPFPLV